MLVERLTIQHHEMLGTSHVGNLANVKFRRSYEENKAKITQD